MTARTNAVTTPEVACPVVDRKETSTGPTMKTNSSTTDSIASAAGSRCVPWSRWVKRTRFMEATGGMQAPARDRKSVGEGKSVALGGRRIIKKKKHICITVY